MKERSQRLENLKKYVKLFFKVAKPGRLFILIIVLMVNTFGWFIFSSRVSTSLDVHVSAWDVLFEAGNSPITDYVFLDIDNIYPGMTPYHYEMGATNRGDMDASVNYKILEFSMLGVTHYTVEGRAEAGLDPVSTDMTSAQLVTALATSTEFPFVVTMGFDADVMAAHTGEALFSFDLTWPYESGHDEQDTILGQQAYTFKESNPDDPAITLKLKIFISQINPNNNP